MHDAFSGARHFLRTLSAKGDPSLTTTRHYGLYFQKGGLAAAPFALGTVLERNSDSSRPASHGASPRASRYASQEAPHTTSIPRGNVFKLLRAESCRGQPSPASALVNTDAEAHG